jgi:predicted amidophosphoribosyltransferase
MKTCPTCGATLDDATMFCTQCGTNLQGAPDFSEVGSKVGLAFGPEDIHVMYRMGSY